MTIKVFFILLLLKKKIPHIKNVIFMTGEKNLNNEGEQRPGEYSSSRVHMWHPDYCISPLSRVGEKGGQGRGWLSSLADREERVVSFSGPCPCS